jgi:hypothetical protein
MSTTISAFDGTNLASIAVTPTAITIASLAGTGTRNVVVDSNGVLSAP